MTKFLANLPWVPLVLAAIFMGLSPFVPEPHLYEKVKMLFAGALTRPIDIFDMLFHLAPTLLLVAKWVASSKS